MQWRRLERAATAEQLLAALLGAGAEVDAVHPNPWCGQRTALSSAAEQGFAACVRMLLAHGASVRHRDADKWTALHWAAHARTGDPAGCVLALLAAGSDVRAEGPWAMTPLNAAAYACAPGAAWAVLPALVAAGADVQQRNRYGETALDSAVKGWEGDSLVLVATALIRVGAAAGDGFWRAARVRALPRGQRGALMVDAAWARRGHLIRLRRRRRQAWDAELDAREAAEAQEAEKAGRPAAPAAAAAAAGSVATGADAE
jgi:hypothetical protein